MAEKIIEDKMVNHKDIDSKLESKKNMIRDSYEWFLDNYKTYNNFNKFVFKTSLSDDDKSLMKELGKPILEFNILEAYISRQRGEFAKQEPSIQVRPSNVLKLPVDPKLIEVIENHFRAIIDNANDDDLAYNTFSDQCAGGFSAWRIYTDYENEHSFDQNIYWRRTYDPTLTGFDKLARECHKGDGSYCFEIIPKTKEEFENEYGTRFTKDIKFSKSNHNLEGFTWSYETSSGKAVILVAEFFEKRIEKKKIVQLADGQVFTEDDYNKFIDMWDKSGMIMMPPTVINSRISDIINIDRYLLTEKDIIKYTPTDYRYLPIIFIDGNSRWIKMNEGGSSKQVTRPMVYHAESIQKLKNFAGITLANELENFVQHKFKVPIEAIPAEYKDAYTNVQKPNTLVYQQFKDNDPNVRLDPPQEIARMPAPPELMATFTVSDEVTQAILGNYDAIQGIQGNQISGRAIVKAAMQSNATVMPYIVNYINGLNRACRITLDLLPKYYKTPRSIPIKGIDGKRNFALINVDNYPKMQYNPDSLEVKVEAGVNFEVQRSESLETLKSLMQISPILNKMISMTEEGVMMLLDNIDIRGIDSIKSMIPNFIKQETQQMQQQQQMEMQQKQIEMQQLQNFNPVISELKKVEQRQQESVLRYEQAEKDRQIDAYKAETDRIAVAAKAEKEASELGLKKSKAIHEAKKDLNDMIVKNI